MISEAAYRELRNHLGTMQGIEILFVLLLLALLNGLFLNEGVRSLDRAGLTSQISDIVGRRVSIAESLARTGMLPQEWRGNARYRFDFLEEGQYAAAAEGDFREQLRAIEQRYQAVAPGGDEPDEVVPAGTGGGGQPDRGSAREIIEGRLASYAGGAELEPGAQRSNRYGELVYGTDFFIVDGSVYYLVDELRSADDPGTRIVGFRLNSREAGGFRAFWHDCGRTDAIARGPDITSPSILALGGVCRDQQGRP